MASLILRPLSAEQRARAFVGDATLRKQALFVDTVREMEGGIAYAIATNGSSARAIRVNMNKAAKARGFSLHWAKLPKDAPEVVVELAGDES